MEQTLKERLLSLDFNNVAECEHFFRNFNGHALTIKTDRGDGATPLIISRSGVPPCTGNAGTNPSSGEWPVGQGILQIGYLTVTPGEFVYVNVLLDSCEVVLGRNGSLFVSNADLEDFLVNGVLLNFNELPRYETYRKYYGNTNGSFRRTLRPSSSFTQKRVSDIWYFNILS